MRHGFRKLKLRSKALLLTYCVVVPLLIVICAVLIRFRYQDLAAEEDQMQAISLSNLGASLDIVQEDARNLSINLAIDKDILSILNASDPEALNQITQLWSDSTPINFVEDQISLKEYFKTVSIYPENGVTPLLRCFDRSAYVASLDQLRETDIYQNTLARRGKTLWSAMPKGAAQLYQSEKGGKLVISREVYDNVHDAPKAFITLGISEDYIRGLCANALHKDTEVVLVYNDEGTLLLREGGDPALTDAELVLAGSILREAGEEEKLAGDLGVENLDASYMCYTAATPSEQWRIAKLVPRFTLWDIFEDAAYIPIIEIITLLLILSPVIIMICTYTTRPLEKVCNAMEAFQDGDFSQRLDFHSDDEVGRVGRCFNEMVVTMDDLINKNYLAAIHEKESELDALQAQINPHFLYNALDSIYWQAMGVDDEDTANSIYELSQLFRLVLGRGNSMVTVEVELQLVERYLQIQQLRYHDQLNFTIDTDPACSVIEIPKLILQPFVENAVIHGMQTEKHFVVAISTRMVGEERIAFTIADNGVGMTQEQLANLWDTDTDTVYKGQRIGRYAIKNVRERLHLKYGEAACLRVESEAGRGTRVIIEMPAVRGVG